MADLARTELVALAAELAEEMGQREFVTAVAPPRPLLSGEQGPPSPFRVRARGAVVGVKERWDPLSISADHTIPRGSGMRESLCGSFTVSRCGPFT
jgi:hypothetical protein